MRDLGWRAAAAGYPTLVARRNPSSPSGLEVSGLLTRLIGADGAQHEVGRLYEVPCVLIFDQSDWAGRLNELLNFAREIARSGRRVCIVLPMGPQVGIDVLSDSRFVELAILSHRVEARDALRLGDHLNRFLAPHNSARTAQEWHAFFNASAVTQGVAAFW
ncbi:hypothetical protein AB4Y99_27880, partial [Bosea sp. TAB14]